MHQIITKIPSLYLTLVDSWFERNASEVAKCSCRGHSADDKSVLISLTVSDFISVRMTFIIYMSIWTYEWIPLTWELNADVWEVRTVLQVRPYDVAHSKPAPRKFCTKPAQGFRDKLSTPPCIPHVVWSMYIYVLSYMIYIWYYTLYVIIQLHTHTPYIHVACTYIALHDCIALHDIHCNTL